MDIEHHKWPQKGIGIETFEVTSDVHWPLEPTSDYIWRCFFIPIFGAKFK